MGLSSPNTKSTSKETIKNLFYQCIHCLWVSRISIQLNRIPCLLYLLILLFISLFYVLEYSNPNSYYNLNYSHTTITTSTINNSNNNSKKNNNNNNNNLNQLSFNPNDENFATLEDLQSKLESTYPNTIVLSTPLSRSDLGVLSWTLLHTMAVNYPEIPNEERQKDLLLFWQSFSRLYPCGECAKHMRDNLKFLDSNSNTALVENIQSEKEYSLWLCNFHNIVNNNLNKPNIICDYDILENKWKSDEYCGCDNELIEGVDNQANSNINSNSNSNGNNSPNNNNNGAISNNGNANVNVNVNVDDGSEKSMKMQQLEPENDNVNINPKRLMSMSLNGIELKNGFDNKNRQENDT